MPPAGPTSAGPEGSSNQRQDVALGADRSGRLSAGVWILRPRQPAQTEARKDFDKRYRARTGNPPSQAVMQVYDAMRLTVAALRRSGPNRARLRDRLAETQNFVGVSGAISFDHAGNDVAGATLVRLYY